MHSSFGERDRARAPLRIGRACRALIIAVAAVAVLLAAAVGVTSTEWFRRALERRVVASLEDFTGGRVEIRSMHFNPLVLQVTFHGVILHGSEPASQPPLFRAQTLAPRLSLVPFARRDLRHGAVDR